MSTKKAQVGRNGEAAARLKDLEYFDKAPIEIQRIARTHVLVPIIGTAPLLMANFSDKSKRQMLEKQLGKKTVRQPKDPDQCFKDAQYVLGKNKWGMPAENFKAAIVGAARFFDKTQLPMTLLKVAIYVHGDELLNGRKMIALDTEAPIMHEGPVRNATGVADLRYRPLFENWAATLHIEFPKSVLSLDSLLALVDCAGMGGIGDWRPSSPKCATGQYGTFTIDDAKAIKELAL